MLLYDNRYAWVITNKPTQYTLVCDRQANDLGKFFALHPAVLRVLKMATDAAHKSGIWIGICDELGADLSFWGNLSSYWHQRIVCVALLCSAAPDRDPQVYRHDLHLGAVGMLI